MVKKMAANKSRDWLTVNRMHKELKWLSYDPDYSSFDFGPPLEFLSKLKEKLAKELEK